MQQKSIRRIFLLIVVAIFIATIISYNQNNTFLSTEDNIETVKGINISGNLTDVYCVALDSFMPLDNGLNYEMQYISIDGSSLKYLQDNQIDEVLKYFKKYNVKVINASFDVLKEKGLFNEKKLVLDGLLLSVKDINIISNTYIIVEGSKYRSGDGAIGVKCALKYKDGKWNVEKADIMWIS
jgi:hypothetical protein